MARTSIRRTTRLAAVLAAVALVAGACSSDSDEPAAKKSPSPSASASPTRGTGPYPVYVALGDSFTAAPGVPKTDSDDGCLRSDGNYPHLLAASLGSGLTDVSCSGADSTALVGVQRTSDGEIHPAQFDALSDTTDLVTVGMGGNDLQLFSSVLGACVSQAQSEPNGTPCTDAGASKVAPTLKQIQDRLAAVFAGVKNRAPNATVVAVGYPQVIPQSGTCRDLLPLAAGDYPFARKVNQGLDDAVRAAAKQSKVLFADIWTASAGHDICASDPWINGIKENPGAIPFHPFAAEQKAVAAEIEKVLPKGAGA